VAASDYHICVLTEAGGVRCWGDNRNGAIGDGTTINRIVPTQVAGLTSGVAAIATGDRVSCAVKSSGDVWCWGCSDRGCLGDGTNIDRTVPTRVVGLTAPIAAISMGMSHVCAINSERGVVCWGSKGDGEFADRRDNQWGRPNQVVGLESGVVAISSGGAHTCAITENGAALCWGFNGFGQLGDGTKTSRDIPTGVVGLGNKVMAISAGHRHTCAVRVSGEALCWGANGFWPPGDGRLGDGTTVDRLVPTPVVGFR